MRYEVHQINFTDEQRDEINGSDGKVEYYNRYLNATNFPTEEAIVEAMDLYEKVCYIEADGLEAVFAIGNMGPEDKIERVADMHSLSVGDLVIDPAGRKFYVDSCGFGELRG